MDLDFICSGKQIFRISSLTLEWWLIYHQDLWKTLMSILELKFEINILIKSLPNMHIHIFTILQDLIGTLSMSNTRIGIGNVSYFLNISFSRYVANRTLYRANFIAWIQFLRLLDWQSAPYSWFPILREINLFRLKHLLLLSDPRKSCLLNGAKFG